MDKISRIPFNIRIPLMFIFLLGFSQALSAAQEVISDDGREILLKEDGTWEFRSNDRFANTSDGRRVRLKAGGSWQYIGNALLTSKQQLRTTEIDIKLQKVVIETYEKKIQKNKRVKSQTVFFLDLTSSAQAQQDISISKENISNIKVSDSNGRDYPVLFIKPAPIILKPGTQTSIAVRVDGSPQWWKDVESMEISFQSGIFGLQDPASFSQNVVDFDIKKVDGFEN
ncbi:MAG: hypothetical protein HKP12_05125 [Gammaproteobacteria bacterium]|nr:hypothetical protein [Gammaproteobacteria bacterium]